jgi:phage terminase small subunit
MEEILKRYKNYRKEIQEYMCYFLASLLDKYGEINESFIVSLDLLAMNLEILFKSVDEMKEKGMSETDKYRGEKKSGAMQAFFNSQNYIHKLIASFGFTPAARSKIRDNQDAADVAKYLENLVK